MDVAISRQTASDRQQVRLRPISAADLELLERAAVEPEVGGRANWAGFRHAGAVRRQFEADGLLGDDHGELAAVSDEATVGFVSWRTVRHGPGPASRCWQIGIALLPEWRGRGLGAEAQRALTDYLFATSAAVRVEAETLSDHRAERRSLEKAGFALEGTLRSAQFHDGAWRDVVLYSRVRGEALAEAHRTLPGAP
jgi:[ribosomal protein S5]-alanine N-acetyltransferase